ncbi:MAG: hemerythrin domain-containing protein [Bryobacteraceae bacterium]
MPVQIGRREPDFANPLGLLSGCHRRIEQFLSVLSRVARERRHGAMSGDEAASFAKALDYFRGAAPKHTRDEEDSLFPRMREAGGDEVTAAMASLEELETDHAAADAAHGEVDILGRRWLESGCLEKAEANRLVSLLECVSGIYDRHIAVEDRDVFPLAARVLGREEIAAIGEEMAARRGAKSYPDKLVLMSQAHGDSNA